MINENNRYIKALIWLCCTVTLLGFARWLEQSLVANLLLGYPLLVYSGYMLGRYALSHRVTATTLSATGGIPWVLAASFVLAFWMIPRWMDASFAHFDIALLKQLCLIFPVGFVLGCAWPYMHFISRAVIKIELLTMLFRLGWIYMISPDRLCNNYLLSEQVLLGKSLLAIALLLTLVFCFPLFFTRSYGQNTRNCPAISECGS